MKLLAALLLATIPSIRPTQATLPEVSRPKSVVKTSHLGPMSVAITCLNGADPTGQKVGQVLIISCGKGQ